MKMTDMIHLSNAQSDQDNAQARQLYIQPLLPIPMAAPVANNIAPFATSLNRIQSDPSNRSSVDYLLNFSEDVTGVDASDFSLVTSGTVAGTVAGVTQINASTYKVTVDHLIGDGTLQLNLNASGTGILDSGSLELSGGFAGQIYTLDHTAPTTIITSAALSDDTGASYSTYVAKVPNQTISGKLSSALRAGESVQISLDNGNHWANASIATGSTSWSLSDLFLSGFDSIKIHVTDDAGNSGPEFFHGYDSDIDGDGVLASVEFATPNLYGQGNGDGNGDGTLDQIQNNVSSLLWDKSATGFSYITLSGAQGLSFTAVATSKAPATSPTDVELLLGTLVFSVDGVAVGGSTKLSVFVDYRIPINGYWKQNKAGDWVNVADAIVPQGNKNRIDFTVTDGDQFDSDGLVNGHIGDLGAPGYHAPTMSFGMPADMDGDGIPDVTESSVGTNPIVKDNDVFHSAYLFVRQMNRDIYFSEGINIVMEDLAYEITSGKTTREQHAVVEIGYSGFQKDVGGLTRLYFGTFDRLPDRDGLAYWMSMQRGGATFNGIGNEFVASSEFQKVYGTLDDGAFLDHIYQNVLHRSADTEGKAYWLHELQTTESRGNVLVSFTESVEFKAATKDKVALTLDYVGLLGHAPDQAAFDALQAQSGADAVTLVGSIMNSAEYHARFMA